MQDESIMKAPIPKAYGITGGIASGKSTVCRFFRALGIPVIEADEVSREICEKGKEGWKKINEIFGLDVFFEDGTLNRKKLGEIVFSDPQKRKLLESIEHPLILERIRKRVREYFDQGTPLVLVEGALLMESGFDKELHGTIVISCAPEDQMRRLGERDGLTREEALKRIKAQWTLEEKVKRATFVIDNSKDFKTTEAEVKNVFDKIREKRVRRLPLWH